MRHKSNLITPKSRIKPVQKRFNASVALLRELRVSPETKDLQKEIEWIRKDIEDYSFEFFPNLYVFDLVLEFEQKANELANHKSSKVITQENS